MLSNKQTEKLIKHPRCFESLNKNCQLLDIIIFEISVRLCAQSLFLTNASFYLDICTKVLCSLFEKKSYKPKKNKTQMLEELFLRSENSGELIFLVFKTWEWSIYAHFDHLSKFGPNFDYQYNLYKKELIDKR